jgi:inorganic pyrophosphatase
MRANIVFSEDHEIYVIEGERSFLSGWPATEGEFVNVVIEIPAGSVDKWEVRKSDGALAWEINKGSYRKVKYLPYPANYGMVPRTLLPKSLGGDGDPLDVIVLGPAIVRGSVVSVTVIGVLKLLDHGEQDDKLIAILKGSDFDGLSNMSSLGENFKGVKEILALWFENYKGPGKMEVLEFAGADEANKILQSAIREFHDK